MTKKSIMLIATGGTIAGVGTMGDCVGYVPGKIDIDRMTDELNLPEDYPNISTVQICNINSDDINDKIWIKLAGLINEKASDDSVDGFVITHGTDTLEETAYFLNLTVNTDKPVVITGSMRPTTALSKDGPGNLRDAITVAQDIRSKGRGVLVVFANKIYSARYVTKLNTISMDAMTGGLSGCMGTVIDGEIVYFYHIDKRHTVNSELALSEDILSLKQVNIVYFASQTSVSCLRYALDNSDGVVIAGAGMGEYSEEFINAITNADIPCVITSRVPQGWVNSKCLINDNVIPAFDLNPQKAAVLLRLAISTGKSSKDLIRLFDEY